VVGADVLGYIPFELLPLGKEAGSELLGEALAVDYLSSVHVGQFLYQRNLGRSESTGLDMTLFSAPVVVSAVTESWPEARSIPFGDSHAEALLAPYRKAQEWRGKAATLEALASVSVTGSRVLHVLTHGVVDPERVHPVGLVFADGTNGVAWHSELSKLAYPPLVIVTACEVASMNSLRGEDGVASLANMFLAGGADAALVSPVRQDLNDATELASAVHRHVASGASVAEAVRRARRAFRAKPERAHPFHSLIHVIGWGGVQLFGERR
jgi:CHAT domain-containing protein